MTHQEIADKIINDFKKIGLDVYLFADAKTGSKYLKFSGDMNKLGSIRIADHKNIEKYKYKWNVRTDKSDDFKIGWTKEEGSTWRFYCTPETLDKFYEQFARSMYISPELSSKVLSLVTTRPEWDEPIKSSVSEKSFVSDKKAFIPKKTESEKTETKTAVSSLFYFVDPLFFDLNPKQELEKLRKDYLEFVTRIPYSKVGDITRAATNFPTFFPVLKLLFEEYLKTKNINVLVDHIHLDKEAIFGFLDKGSVVGESCGLNVSLTNLTKTKKVKMKFVTFKDLFSMDPYENIFAEFDRNMDKLSPIVGEILSLEEFEKRLRAFNWNFARCDGGWEYYQQMDAELTKYLEMAKNNSPEYMELFRKIEKELRA